MYTLDTNALIYYFKDDPEALDVFGEILDQRMPLYISTITELELFSFSHLSEKEVFFIEDILETVAIIPLDSRLARMAGFLRRKYRLQIADSVIAATAMFTGSTLLTRNIKDFRKIPDLQLREIYLLYHAVDTRTWATARPSLLQRRRIQEDP